MRSAAAFACCPGPEARATRSAPGARIVEDLHLVPRDDVTESGLTARHQRRAQNIEVRDLLEARPLHAVVMRLDG